MIHLFSNKTYYIKISFPFQSKLFVNGYIQYWNNIIFLIPILPVLCFINGGFAISNINQMVYCDLSYKNMLIYSSLTRL